jgi:hypothetical protein
VKAFFSWATGIFSVNIPVLNGITAAIIQKVQGAINPSI